MIGQGSIGSIGNILGSASALQNITSSTTTAMPLTTSVIFHATIKAANGYIVNIGRREGYEYETFIAESIVQVNEVIAAQMVAMKLEGK